MVEEVKMIKQFILNLNKIRKFAHTEGGRKVITFIKKRKKAKQNIPVENEKVMQDALNKGWEPVSRKEAAEHFSKIKTKGKPSPGSGYKRTPRAENPEETKQLHGIAKKRKEKFKKGGILTSKGRNISALKRKKKKYYEYKDWRKKNWQKLKKTTKKLAFKYSEPDKMRKIGKIAKYTYRGARIGSKGALSFNPIAVAATEPLWDPAEKAIKKVWDKTTKKYVAKKIAPVRHMTRLKKGGLVKPKSVRIATRGWGKVIK